MRPVSLLLSSAIGLSALGCHETTAPPAQTLRAVYQIRVPTSAAATDSIHIAFAANTSPCDNDVTVSSTMNDTGMTFSVSVMAGGCQSGYAPGVYIQPQYSYVVVPPHPVPFTVGFSEPGQPDSVRVVAAH